MMMMMKKKTLSLFLLVVALRFSSVTSVDVGIGQIEEPLPGTTRRQYSTLQIPYRYQLEVLGEEAAADIPLNFLVNGVVIDNTTLAGPFAPTNGGHTPQVGTIPAAFAQWPVTGSVTFTFATAVPGDTDTTNDAADVQLVSVPTPTGLPFFENFNAVPAGTGWDRATSDSQFDINGRLKLGIPGAPAFDYDRGGNYGYNSGSQISFFSAGGSIASVMRAYTTYDWAQNTLIFNVNLEGLDVAVDIVELSFSFCWCWGSVDTAQVRARGSDASAWRTVYTLSGQEFWGSVSHNISDVLQAGGQQYSSSFQIGIIHNGYKPQDNAGGLGIDDISLIHLNPPETTEPESSSTVSGLQPSDSGETGETAEETTDATESTQVNPSDTTEDTADSINASSFLFSFLFMVALPFFLA